MTLHRPPPDQRPRPSSSRNLRRNGLFQLGWPHFWLLVGILGGMLGLVALIFFVHLASLPQVR